MARLNRHINTDVHTKNEIKEMLRVLKSDLLEASERQARDMKLHFEFYLDKKVDITTFDS